MSHASAGRKRGTVSRRTLDRALVAAGFALVRWKGSHATYRHEPTGKAVTVPANKPGRDVPSGFLMALDGRVRAIVGHGLEL